MKADEVAILRELASRYARLRRSRRTPSGSAARGW